MEKKASVRDVILIVVLFFVIGTALFLVNFTSKNAINTLVHIPIVNDTPGVNEVLTNTQEQVDRSDTLAFAFLIGMLLALAITGYFIGGNKIFMFLYFIFIVIAIIASMVLSNAWDSVTTMPIFNVDGDLTISSFPLTNHIISNFAIYTAIFGFIGIIAMFAKPSE